MGRSLIIALVAALTLGAVVGPAQAQGNPPNGRCTLASGAQYSLRAFLGNRMVDERGICDERLSSYTTPMNYYGHQIYVSAYDLDWLAGRSTPGSGARPQGSEVYLYRVNKQTGSRENLGKM